MRSRSITIIVIFIFSALLLQAQEKFESVNSGNDEQAPVMHPSGTHLYFTKANDTANIGGSRDRGDIYVSELQNGKWSTPKNLGKPVNNDAYNAVVGFSPDGDIMFLHHHYTTTGNPGAFTGISYSRRMGNEWSVPEKIGIEYFQNKSTHQSGSLTPNGKYLLLSMESFGTRGAEDIYVCFYDGEKYSQPVNLGNTINTEFQEMAPFLARDEETLYFSSNGHGGYGGRDIFVSKRLDDTWKSWSKPRNLGESINTIGIELYFYLDRDGKSAFYTTTQNSDGYADISKYILPEEDRVTPSEVPDTTVFAVNEPDETVDTVVPDKTRQFSGNVLNTKTGERIEAEVIIQVSGGDTTIISSNDDGFSVELNDTLSRMNVLVKARGFMPVEEGLTFSGAMVNKNYFLTPLEVGATIKLDKVYFHRGEAALIDSSFAELDRVVDILNENPDMEIELAGHTDNRGDADKNLDLSRERVEKVKQYIVNSGIDDKRITGKGYGGSRPIASNASEETRKLNRRVEFIITKK